MNEWPPAPLYYHTIELPDGLHEGVWDCREVVHAYLGHVDFQGKTVLEIGPANGFFTFEMEKRGAKVTCVDLGPICKWDLVPGPLINQKTLESDARITIRQIEAAFWHGHALTKSQSNMLYGTAYETSKLCRDHQIGVVGNVLQHLRDPIGGLMAVAARVTETLIVTEALWVDGPRIEQESFMQLIPRAELPEVSQSWWQLSVPAD